jgi:Protein of unknown function (DUF990).
MKINMPLFITGIKSAWKMLLILCAVLGMYIAIIVAMFDPDIGQALIDLAKAMPELMAMFGMETAETTLIGFIAGYLYGFLMTLMPMIFTIVVSNQMIAHYIDRGSMAYLLAAPVKRNNIVFTQICVLLSGITIMMLFSTVLGLVCCEITFSGELDIPAYLIMNLGAWVLQLFVGGICFVSSCIFNDEKYSLAVGAGIPILAFLFQMVRNFGTEFENLKYFTFFSLYVPKDIAVGNSDTYWGIIVLAVGAVILFTLSIIIFNKKDVPV